MKLPQFALLTTFCKKAMGDGQHRSTGLNKSPRLIEQSRQFDVDGARYLALQTFEASINLFYAT